jgi:hypothetical protein
MSLYQANDKYRAKLRATWISDPAATTLAVDSLPPNLPTLVTVGWKTEFETTFIVTGSSGSSSSDYALTGVTRLKGANTNLPENMAVNCLNNEEFFNQYSQFVNDKFLQMAEQNSAPTTPASGFIRLYGGSDNKWHIKNDAGVVSTLGEISDEWIDVADGATMTFDLSNLTNKLKFKCGALTGNRNFAITNPSPGLAFMIRIPQDAVGSRTVTWFDTASDTVTITIATPCVITTTIDMKTGTPVKFSTTGALPTGIMAGTTYYWIRQSATTGNIASSRANAIAGTQIATSGSQSGVHTMKPQILWPIGVVPTLTTTKLSFDDFGFLVHSTGQITGTIIAQDM